MTNLRTVDLRHEDLHRFVNCGFNSEFKNRNFNTSEFT